MITVTYEFKDQAELEAFVLSTVPPVPVPAQKIRPEPSPVVRETLEEAGLVTKKGRGKAKPKLDLPGKPLEQIDLPVPEPTTYTLDDVQQAIITLNDKKGMTAVNKLLRQSNIAKLKDVPESEYGNLIEACQEEMK